MGYYHHKKGDFEVKAWVVDKEITKHAETKEEAEEIAAKLKEAVVVLGLTEHFKCLIIER